MKISQIVTILLALVILSLIAVFMVSRYAAKDKRKKILIIIGTSMALIIALTVIITAFVMVYVPAALTKEYKSSPQTFTSKNHIGKALVIYEPARTDVTKKAATAIAKSLNKKGYDVTVNFPGNYLKSDISEYDVLVFGSPVYNSKGSPLVVNYIKRINGMNGKKVILFTTGSTTPIKKDKVYIGLESVLKNAANVQRIKFSNKTDDKKLADETVDKLCGLK